MSFSKLSNCFLVFLCRLYAFFKSQECFDRHKQTVGNAKSICASLVKCFHCGFVVKRGKLRPDLHHCGKTRCSICKEYVPAENHQCYMQPVKERSTRRNQSESDMLDNEAHDGDDAPQSGYNELQQVGNLSSLTKKSREKQSCMHLHSKQSRKLARSCFS